MTMAGIYLITNTVNGKVYVGSAVDTRRRWLEHQLQLNQQRHNNIYLTRAWFKHGSESFTFEVIEPIEELEQLIVREQYWIDHYDSATRDKGYNLSPTAGSILGYKFTPEQSKRVSEALTGKPKSPEHCANIWSTREVTEEFRELMRENGRKGKGKKKPDGFNAGGKNAAAKVTEAIVLEIRQREDESTVALASEYGLDRSTVRKIITGKTWKHVV